MYKEIVPFFFTFFDDYVNGNEQQFGGCILKTTKRNKRKSSSPFLFFQHHICPHHLVYKTSTAYNQNILESIKIKLVISKRHQMMIANKYGKNWLDGDEEIKDLDCNKREQKENRES